MAPRRHDVTTKSVYPHIEEDVSTSTDNSGWGKFGHCRVIEIVPLFAAIWQANPACSSIMSASHAAKMIADRIKVIDGIGICGRAVS